MRRILVAGIGNILRGDDGFGNEVIRRLTARGALPEGVAALEFGIAGISFVQELMDRYDVLMILDTMNIEGPPGVLRVVEPVLPSRAGEDMDQLRESLGDPHWTDPYRALILARALGVLPKKVFLIGCNPATCDPHIGLSPAVDAAADSAVREILLMTEQFLS